MLEHEGPLHRAVLSRTLWLVLIGPVLGLLWQLLVARVRTDQARGGELRRELAHGGWAGVAGIFAATAMLAAEVLRMTRLPAGERALFEHVISGTRLPGLDAPLDLWLDGHSAAGCGLACAMASAAAVRLTLAPSFERTWPRWTWLQLALLGALVAFLADNLVTVVAGWGLAAAAGVWLAGWNNPRESLPAAMWACVGGASVLVGAALLFWGLGGSWDDGHYEADAPALVAVRTKGQAGEGTLTMLGSPGALVYLDDAWAPSFRSPFVRAPVLLGPHVVRVATGDAIDVRARFVLAEGDDTVLVPVGPTLSIHSMRDALDLLDVHGEPLFRRALESRVAPGGIGVVAGVVLAWLLAVGSLSAVHAAVGAPGALAALSSAVTTSLLGPMLLVRTEFLFPSAMHTGLVIACAGAGLVLGATWRALPHDGVSRWLVFMTGAPTGLSCVVLGLDGGTSALAAAAWVSLGVAGLNLFVKRTVDRDDWVNDPEAAWILRVPERLGSLLTAMEHGVVGSITGGAAGASRIAAWIVAKLDELVVTTPVDGLANQTVRVSRAIEPTIGVGLVPMAWTLLGLVGALALLHALWPGG